MGVAGRPLILAQVTEGVASAAVLSTLVVASVILFMLIGLQSVEKRDKKGICHRTIHVDSSGNGRSLGLWINGI